MNNLGKVLNHKKLNDEKVLVAYLVAGDPDLENSLDLMHLLVEAGVDIIELGVPFTDPIAEGPVIQKAHDRALKNNTESKLSNSCNLFRYFLLNILVSTGSININLHSLGVKRYKILTIIEFIPTDFPDPVVPAINK